MNKFSKSLVIGFVLTLVLAISPFNKFSDYLYSAFSFGMSSKSDCDNSDDRITIVDDESEVEYKFKILEIIEQLF